MDQSTIPPEPVPPPEPVTPPEPFSPSEPVPPPNPFGARLDDRRARREGEVHPVP